MQNWGSEKPMGRPAQPSEVATTFVFLASVDAWLYCKFLFNVFEANGVDGQIMHPYPLGD